MRMDNAGRYNNPETELERGYKKALTEAPKIVMSDFLGFYGEEEVARDEAFAINREKDWMAKYTPIEGENYFLAKAFEGVVCSKTKKWYGENSEAKLASSHDDTLHGADVILSFHNEKKETFSVGVDVTLSKGHVEKFKKIKEEIEKGTLGTIKYFDSQEGGKEKVPHVVIGVEGTEAKNMNTDWLEGKESLNTHWASYEFIVQILIQLHAFKEYAKTERNKEAVGIYERGIHAIHPFLEMTKKHTRDMASGGAYTLKIIENLKEAGIFFDLKEAVKILKK